MLLYQINSWGDCCTQQQNIGTVRKETAAIISFKQHKLLDVMSHAKLHYIHLLKIASV